MASIFDMLYEDDAGPQNKDLAAALRKQFNYGTLGQLMGVDPTTRAGESMQDQAGGSLKLALQKQQDKRDAAARKAEQDQAQKRWEADAAESKRQFGANYGLKERELGIAQAKADRELQGGDWKVRIDPMGNPLGWMNDRGDFMTVDQQFFPAPGSMSGGASRGAPTAGQIAPSGPGPAMPAAGPAGSGGGAQNSPSAGLFGLPPAPFAPPAARGGDPLRSAPPPPGAQAPLTQYDPARQASLRLGRLKSLSAEQQNKYGTAIAQRDRLPSLIEQVDANRNAFGITQDIAQHIPGQPGTPGGVVQGIVRSTQDKFRDPVAAEVRSRVYQEAYEVIHALAGAALSTGEANRILGFMPGPTDPPEKILANLRSAYSEANRNINTIEAMAGVPEQIRSKSKPLPERKQQGSPQAAEEEIIDLPSRNR